MERPLIFQTIALVVSILAFLRPEFSRWLRRWTNRLEFSFASRMEIGFSNLGPTIGVLGSVVAIRGDQLITDMSITVTRLRDSASNSFEWAAFRPTNILASADKADIAVTSAFTLKHREFKQVNIHFHDTKSRAQYEGKLLELRALFASYAQMKQIDVSKLDAKQLMTVGNQFGAAHPNILSDAENLTRRFFFWEAGAYSWNLRVATSHPRKAFEFANTFSLSQQESNLLATNIGALIIGLTLNPNVQFNFAFPLIEKGK